MYPRPAAAPRSPRPRRMPPRHLNLRRPMQLRHRPRASRGRRIATAAVSRFAPDPTRSHEPMAAALAPLSAARLRTTMAVDAPPKRCKGLTSAHSRQAPGANFFYCHRATRGILLRTRLGTPPPQSPTAAAPPATRTASPPRPLRFRLHRRPPPRPPARPRRCALLRRSRRDTCGCGLPHLR